MNLLLLFSIGLLASFIGALPLGTVNLAVIHNSIYHSKKSAMTISYFAGIAEVIIAIVAFISSKPIFKFIQQFPSIQYAIPIVLITIGFALIYSKEKKEKTAPKIKIGNSLKGLVLGIVNPAVWAYWVVVFSFLIMTLNKDYHISPSIFLWIAFFIAVYLGKIIALYLYAKLGNTIANKNTKKIKTIIGIVLICTSFIQIISKSI